MEIRSSATPLSTTNVESVRTGSIRETLEHLQRTGNHDLLKELAISDRDRSTIRHDEWMEFGEMPVIDLSLLQTDRAGVLKDICKAANEWGFFQIVNHGMPLEVLHNAQAQVHKFFELPADDKKKVNGLLQTSSKEGPRIDGGLLGAYVGDNTKHPGSSLHCAESLAFNLENREHVWPCERNDTFTDAVTKFGSGLDAVGNQVLGLMAEGLGLATETFADHVDGSKALLRWNFYPACPRPTESIGCVQHTDPFILTLLLQDQVGGLQVEKDGEWIGVRPIEGALTVNIGDSLHAWTNGRCKSVLHRVVLNEEVPRISLAAFLNAHPQTTISAPEELIDDSHPRRYKPFTPVEYLTKGKLYREENPNTIKDGAIFLEDTFKF